MDIIVGERYQLGKKIGKGAFGDIYMGEDVTTHTPVAMKMEMQSVKNPQLEQEAKTYRCLQGGVGISQFYFYGAVDTYNVLVMELLGPNLDDMFQFCRGRFSLKTVCMLGQEMLLRVEYLHRNGLVHRDMKPENFALGLNDMANVLYLLDFGLSKRYLEGDGRTHIPYRENRSLTGTPRYASISNHLGVEQSRRDDLESLGYILVYFAKGSLPWQGIHANTKRDKYRRILNKKNHTSLDELCFELPSIFRKYLEYCRKLRFDETPDYAYLRGLFSSYMKRERLENDGMYDWLVDRRDGNDGALPGYCMSDRGDWLYGLDRCGRRELRLSMLKSEVQNAEGARKEEDCSTPNMNREATPMRRESHSPPRGTGHGTARETHRPASSPHGHSNSHSWGIRSSYRSLRQDRQSSWK